MTNPRAITRQERVADLVRGGNTFREVAAIEGVTLYAIESVARQYKRRTGRNISNRWNGRDQQCGFTTEEKKRWWQTVMDREGKT